MAASDVWQWWGADPRPLLLSCDEEPARWVALRGIAGWPDHDPQVRAGRRAAAVGSRLVGELVARLPRSDDGAGASSHESPGYLPNLLHLLADLGWGRATTMRSMRRSMTSRRTSSTTTGSPRSGARQARRSRCDTRCRATPTASPRCWSATDVARGPRFGVDSNGWAPMSRTPVRGRPGPVCPTPRCVGVAPAARAMSAPRGAWRRCASSPVCRRRHAPQRSRLRRPRCWTCGAGGEASSRTRSATGSGSRRCSGRRCGTGSSGYSTRSAATRTCGTPATPTTVERSPSWSPASSPTTCGCRRARLRAHLSPRSAGRPAFSLGAGQGVHLHSQDVVGQIGAPDRDGGQQRGGDRRRPLPLPKRTLTDAAVNRPWRDRAVRRAARSSGVGAQPPERGKGFRPFRVGSDGAR